MNLNVQDFVTKLQKEFDKYQSECFPVRSPEFFCLELNGEAGELANFEKKSWRGRKINHQYFADEAADVLIALMNYSNSRKINLAEAVDRKLQKIEKRRLKMEEKKKK
ncbi:MAG: hypothetical protein NT007_01945 [Candidatus Kapabacteria bacterium]|nr:hypothetical protein [Candidatus Kapabacteria bacterium]